MPDGDLTTKTPIWKQWWFIAIVVVLILAIVYYSGMLNIQSWVPARNTAKSKPTAKTDEDEESESEEDDAEKFVVSGGRSDSNGGDWALKDKIQDINERQRKYIRNSKHTYRYDPRIDSAAPAVYSPEDELQKDLYAM